MLEFEWDPDKALSNVNKHDVAFEDLDASLVTPCHLGSADR